jgi:hypothetical protein
LPLSRRERKRRTMRGRVHRKLKDASLNIRTARRLAKHLWRPILNDLRPGRARPRRLLRR